MCFNYYCDFYFYFFLQAERQAKRFDAFEATCDIFYTFLLVHFIAKFFCSDSHESSKNMWRKHTTFISYAHHIQNKHFKLNACTFPYIYISYVIVSKTEFKWLLGIRGSTFILDFVGWHVIIPILDKRWGILGVSWILMTHLNNA